MVRFIIFNLLFVPSTKPLDKGLATAFSTADKSFSNPEAKQESSFYCNNIQADSGKYQLKNAEEF